MRGLPSGGVGYSATLWGWMTAKTGPSTWSAGMIVPPVVVDDGAVAAGAGEQVDADEVGDVAGAGVGSDVGQGAGLDDATSFEDDDAVGEGVGVDRVVGDEEAHAVEGGEVAAQVPADVTAGAGVEGGERLVEEQQARLGGQGAGQGDALGLAAGEGAGPVGGVVGEPDTLEPGGGAGSGVRLGDAAGAEAEGDVLQRGQVGEQEIVLEDDGDGAVFGADEHVGGGVVERFAVEVDAAAVDRQEPGEAAEQGGLAGTVGAEHGDGFATLGGDVDVEPERAEGVDDPGLEGHAAGGRPPPRNRSRRATSTPNETAMSTRLKTIASSGSISLVR